MSLIGSCWRYDGRRKESCNGWSLLRLASPPLGRFCSIFDGLGEIASLCGAEFSEKVKFLACLRLFYPLILTVPNPVLDYHFSP
jgi:hypothetical protein